MLLLRRTGAVPLGSPGCVAPATAAAPSVAPITEDERWQQLRRCLHDTALPTLIRVGGALVLLYGLPVSRVTALRHNDIHTDSRNRT